MYQCLLMTWVRINSGRNCTNCTDRWMTSRTVVGSTAEKNAENGPNHCFYILHNNNIAQHHQLHPLSIALYFSLSLRWNNYPHQSLEFPRKEGKTPPKCPNHSTQNRHRTWMMYDTTFSLPAAAISTRKEWNEKKWKKTNNATRWKSSSRLKVTNPNPKRELSLPSPPLPRKHKTNNGIHKFQPSNT